MKIPLSWLREYIDLDVSVEELCERMTMLGLEIEKVEQTGGDIQSVVVGKILSVDPHPDADKLVVCKTEVGRDEPVQIVCGAKNMKAGDKVPTALVGGELPGGFKIAKRKMRGVESQGMMCSASELGLGDDHDGLLILDASLEVGADIRDALGLQETVLEIEVTPNRNDWSGLIGIARELCAVYELPLKIPEVALREGAKKAADVSSVTIEDPELCPRYVGRLIEGLKVGPSPDWLAQRLVAAGQRPINNVVDITNYVLLETGQPLHAFDTDKLKEGRIVVRRARQGESIVTIDEEKRALSDDMLIIADAEVPVAVAGVMGGFGSEVGEGTTRVFVESAYFAPGSIRKTSRSLNLITEASQRFQRGADPDMALYAANRVCQLVLECAGGTLLAGALDEHPAPLEARTVELRYARTNALLGTDVSGETQTEYLVKLGFEKRSGDDDSATFRVPLRRNDVTREADLIEEVGRLYGYDNIPETLPQVRPVATVHAPHYPVLRALHERLVDGGLTEVFTWTFASEEETRNSGVEGALGDAVALDNPLSENHAIMRTTLIPGLLRTASNSIRKHRRDLTLYEMGPVYRSANGDELPKQGLRLAMAFTGNRSAAQWSGAARPMDLYDLKGCVEDVLDFFGETEVVFESIDSDHYTTGMGVSIQVRGLGVGSLGAVCESVGEAFDIEQDIFTAELDLQPLLRRRTKPVQFEEVPTHPPSLRDIAVVVESTVPAGSLQKSAEKAGGKLLREVTIFDIYTGEQVPEGKKSVALSLTFQSAEKTLTDKDTQKAWNKILKTLEHQFGAELR